MYLTKLVYLLFYLVRNFVLEFMAWGKGATSERLKSQIAFR